MIPEFKSKEELFTYQWLSELQEKGYIGKIDYEPLAFELCSEVIIFRKTKTGVLKEYTLTPKRIYTPDFVCAVLKPLKDTLMYKDNLEHGKKFRGLIVERSKTQFGRGLVYIETKGMVDTYNSIRDNNVKRSIIHDKYGTYINQIKIPHYSNTNSQRSIFQDTFVPQGYIDHEDNTVKKTGKSKIKFNYYKINEWEQMKIDSE